jgi:serine/threonine protein kinase
MSDGETAKQSLEERAWIDRISYEVKLNSDRFTITDPHPLGTGTWGVIFNGYDKELDEEVAIKIHRPTDYARAQMERHKVTPIKAVKKGVRRRRACAHLVPTEYYRTDDGIGFIVMPKYKKFFNQVLDEAMPRTNVRGMQESGLTMDQIIKFSEDIAAGIREFHKYEHRAHCDIKPDNIAMDEDGRLLLADFGTATFTSMHRSSDPRDNKGYLYIRAPNQFRDDAHPTKSSDSFSFDSTLYKMITGEYLFQKEIDEAIEKDGAAGVKRWMTEFSPYKPNHMDLINKKMEKVPPELRNFMIGCIDGWYRDGAELQQKFHDAVEEYRKGETKREVLREIKKEAPYKWLRRLVTGVGIAAALTGFSWFERYAPQPDFSKREDIVGMIHYRSAENSNLTLQIEHEYKKLPHLLPATADPHEGEMAWFTRDRSTLAHIITDAYMRTCEETGTPFDEIGFKIKHREYTMQSGSESMHGRDALQAVVGQAIAANTRGTTVDLEDALTITHLGFDSWKMAVKDAHSDHFTQYQRFLRKRVLKKDSHIDYEHIISKEDQNFIQQWLYNVTQALPLKVRTGSGSYQSGSGATAPADGRAQ